MKTFKILLVFCLKINFLFCSSNNNWQRISNTFALFETKNLLPDLEFIDSFYKWKNISKECSTSIFDTINSLKKLEYWSYQMYDSWGRFPPMGILEGTVADLGHYDQCLSIKPNEVITESQYCLIEMKMPLPEPQPLHININNKVNVLPQFLNISKNNFLAKLSDNSIYFYLYAIRQGICAPKKCDKNDLTVLAKNGNNFFNFFL